MTLILIQIIILLEKGIILLVFASVIMSYFMQPYHPVREAVDKFVNPMLRPIQRVVPNVGMIDFSPLVLIVLVQLIRYFLVNLLLYLR